MPRGRPKSLNCKTVLSFSVSPEIAKQVESLAEKEKKRVSQVLREIVEAKMKELQTNEQQLGSSGNK